MSSKLFSILGLILVIIISGCISQETSQLQQIKPSTNYLSTEEITVLNNFCDKSNSPEKCRILVSLNPDSCENLEEKDRSDCYRELAVISKNPALCEKIIDEQISDRCNSQLKNLLKNPIDIAISTHDISPCNDYRDPGVCIIKVAHALRDSSICDEVTHLKQRCLAVANTDPEMCNNADYPDSCLNEVYKGLSIIEKDTSYCDKLKVELTYGEPWNCYWDVAVASEDSTICETSKFSSSCYSYVATKLKRPAICDNIESEVTRPICYYVAVLASLEDYSVKIEKNQECIHKEPTIVISPESQKITAGDTAVYSVSVTNNDNTLCKQSDFKIIGHSSLTAISDITYEFGDNKLQPINPGASLTIKVYVSTNSKAPSRSYSFTVSATNNKAEFYSSNAKATVSLK